MKTTWQTDFLTLELLPCGTIHMTYNGFDENDNPFDTFDKITQIFVDKTEDTLILVTPNEEIHEFPQLGLKFLRETNGDFPIVEQLTLTPPINIIDGEWDENGKPTKLMFIENNHLFTKIATPTGDYVETQIA